MPRLRPRAFLKSLGSRIRARRLYLGRNRIEAAQQIGISVQQLTMYESGEGHPPAATLHRIASSLGVSSSSLLGEDLPGNAEQIESMTALYADPAVGAVIRYMHAMSQEHRKSLHAIAAALSARSQSAIQTAEVMR